ncbi:unknown [Amedibacillus dolichus CAG:375]|uniref:Uncharacterized protein n=1 Tax=Amedibacillus dolichus CAG:375 TaxID=1263076 RepID=R7G2H2_9FIRM|nr:unknown [Amedibacillus dolichus CAG:375]
MRCCKGTCITRCRFLKTICQFCHLIAMAHPYNLFFRQAFKKRTINIYTNFAASIFFRFTSLNLSTIHFMRHLHAIANSQNRNTCLINRRITHICMLIIYAIWTTAENNTFDITKCFDFINGQCMRVQF